MTIEDALRELVELNATIAFATEGGKVTISIASEGRRVGWTFDRESCSTSALSVVSWKIVTLTKALKKALAERENVMANVHRRTCELFDMQSPDTHKLTARDLLQFAQIVDEELFRVEKSIGVKRGDARGLVDAYGQTETKG